MVPIFYVHLSPYDFKLVTRVCFHNSLQSSWADVSVLLGSWISSYGLTVHDADTTINGFWTLATSTFLLSFMSCFLMVSYWDYDGAVLLTSELVWIIVLFRLVKPRQGWGGKESRPLCCTLNCALDATLCVPEKERIVKDSLWKTKVSWSCGAMFMMQDS